MINVAVSAKILKNIKCAKKNKKTQDPGTCTCENSKNLGSIIGDQ